MNASKSVVMSPSAFPKKMFMDVCNEQLPSLYIWYVII